MRSDAKTWHLKALSPRDLHNVCVVDQRHRVGGRHVVGQGGARKSWNRCELYCFKCAKTLFGVSEKKFRNATFTGGVNNFSVPLLVGLAGDDEKKDEGNVIVDHDDLAGDHDVLGEVRTAWILELLLNVLAPVAHLI